MVSAARWGSARFLSCDGVLRSFVAARATFGRCGSSDPAVFCGPSFSLQAGEDEDKSVGGCRRVVLLRRRAGWALWKMGGALVLVSGGRRRGRDGGGPKPKLVHRQDSSACAGWILRLLNMVVRAAGVGAWRAFLLPPRRRAAGAWIRFAVWWFPASLGCEFFLASVRVCVCVVILRISNSLQKKGCVGSSLPRKQSTNKVRTYNI